MLELFRKAIVMQVSLNWFGDFALQEKVQTMKDELREKDQAVRELSAAHLDDTMVDTVTLFVQLKTLQSQYQRVRTARNRKEQQTKQSAATKLEEARQQMARDRQEQDQFVQKLQAQIAETHKKKQSLESRLEMFKSSMTPAIKTEQEAAVKELQRTKRQWIAEEKVCACDCGELCPANTDIRQWC